MNDDPEYNNAKATTMTKSTALRMKILETKYHSIPLYHANCTTCLTCAIYLMGFDMEVQIYKARKAVAMNPEASLSISRLNDHTLQSDLKIIHSESPWTS